ncbi:hypothetical protein C6988_10180 [Nitrosopumilus sp. b1]|uniref:hypothetical protein n=1 Tax=Nitrosopumilus sp. b1 TaxID=2109907 RepID=UPI0015F45D99|nr:hypothetical protein [Nitrosopumilus sp. b1]KAF6242087.1 hypothetical protein C6988_10180 [Nitrosopumilus sp. b1]
MTLVHEKKGGPYNKEDQEARRTEVARLHFELGYSARKIADMMQVSRNTINSDVKHHYGLIKEEIRSNKEDYVIQQLGRLEAQRARVAEKIADSTDSLKFERMLFEIDSKIEVILGKIPQDITKIDESIVRDTAIFLAIKLADRNTVTERQIISEILHMQQCTYQEAVDIFSKMCSLGLSMCRESLVTEEIYHLGKFLLLRNYMGVNSELYKRIHGNESAGKLISAIIEEKLIDVDEQKFRNGLENISVFFGPKLEII